MSLQFLETLSAAMLNNRKNDIFSIYFIISDVNSSYADFIDSDSDFISKFQ